MNAIVLSHKRTGSTFFHQCLKSHPDIQAHGELFGLFMGNLKDKRKYFKNRQKRYFFHRNNQDIQEYISDVFNSSNKSVVFKLMYGQFRYWKIADDLIRMNVPIIHLMRRNKIKHFISLVTAGGVKNKPLNVTPDELIKEVIDLEEKDKRFQEFLSNCIKKKTEIYYEDIIGENKGELTFMDEKMNEKICDFLQIKSVQMSSRTKKKRPENIWKYIPNKKKVIEVFKENNRLHYIE